MIEPLARPAPPRLSLMDRLRERFLLRALENLGPLRVDQVPLPGTVFTVEVTHPGGGPDSDLPYWAEIWPSGVVLAGVIARAPARLRGRRVLELGPGVGVTATAAVQAGADLIVADNAPACLLLCARNVRHQTGMAPRTLRLNWRRPGDELFAVAGDGFDIVLAADVLYEEVDVKHLTRLMERIIAPGGEAWLAEPGREPAEAFVALMAERGWAVASEACDCPWPDPQELEPGTVMVHRLVRPLTSPPRTGRGRS